MAQKYIMWGDVNNVPFITLNKGKFECILKSISFSQTLLKYACCYDTNLTSVSFPELTAISGQYAMEYAFIGCTNLTSVSFPKLTTLTYPSTALSCIGPSTLTVHLPKALSSLGITNNGGSTSSNYCSFVYDL